MMARRFFLTFIIMAVMVSAAGCVDYVDTYRAEKGVMDLTSWNPDSRTIVSLEGDWEFYWKKLYTPVDFNNGTVPAPRYVEVPSIWTNTKINDKTLDFNGFATYRLRVKIPVTHKPYSLRVYTLINAYRIWVNGTLVNEIGTVSSNPEEFRPQYKPEEYHLFLTQKDNEIIIQIANQGNVLGGFWTPISIGSSANMTAYRDTLMSLDNFLLGLLLLISLYYMGFFLVRRKDKVNLWFSIFAFVMGFRILSLGEQRLLAQIMDPYAFAAYRLTQVSFYTAGAFFFIFIYNIFSDSFFEKLYTFTKYLVLAVAVALFIIPVSWIGHITTTFIGITAFYVFAAIVVISRAVIKKNPGAVLFLVSTFVLIVPVVNDILNLLNVVSTGFFAGYGVTGFVLMQSIILLRRYGLSFNTLEELTSELQLAKSNLEQKVVERTQEVNKAYENLNAAYDEIKKDLLMAKNIQTNILPTLEEPLNVNLVIKYLPMIEVGGDIYDVDIQTPAKMRLFLADATGHGVVASLVTMLIKNEYDKKNDRERTPFEVLYDLNEIFYNKYFALNMFFTAIIVDIDISRDKINYASAGSPPAYIVSSGRLIKMTHTCRAIGFMPNLTGNNQEKPFHEGDKLFLYTDGLSEEFNHEEEMFGEECLTKTLQEHSSKNVGSMVESVLHDVNDFMDGTTYSDDLTIIAVERKSGK